MAQKPAGWRGMDMSANTVNRRVDAYNYTYSASGTAKDLHADLITDGWDGVTAKAFNITINASVNLDGTTSSNWGLKIQSTWPARTSITVTTNASAQIRGFSGPGGAANTDGGAGGSALYVRYPTTFTNNGTILAGGGGGGGGRGRTNGANTCSGVKSLNCANNATCTGGAGGAGAGTAGATGSSGSSGVARTCAARCPACTGSCGCGCTGGTGGTGGNASNDGASGSASSDSGTCTGGAIGAGGSGAGTYAVDGDSYVTWDVTGTITGTQGN